MFASLRLRHSGLIPKIFLLESFSGILVHLLGASFLARTSTKYWCKRFIHPFFSARGVNFIVEKHNTLSHNIFISLMKKFSKSPCNRSSLKSQSQGVLHSVTRKITVSITSEVISALVLHLLDQNKVVGRDIVTRWNR